MLHRIIVIQNGHYFFKGDNNDFVDPGYATQGALVGTLWFKVSAVGGALNWFSAQSAHAAFLHRWRPWRSSSPVPPQPRVADIGEEDPSPCTSPGD